MILCNQCHTNRKNPPHAPYVRSVPATSVYEVYCHVESSARAVVVVHGHWCAHAI